MQLVASTVAQFHKQHSSEQTKQNKSRSLELVNLWNAALKKKQWFNPATSFILSHDKSALKETMNVT